MASIDAEREVGKKVSSDEARVLSLPLLDRDEPLFSHARQSKFSTGLTETRDDQKQSDTEKRRGLIIPPKKTTDQNSPLKGVGKIEAAI